MEKFVGIGRISKITGCSTEALRYWIEKGKGPPFKRTPGGHYLFRESDIWRWLPDAYRGMNTAGFVVSLTEAAEMLGISRWTLKWWIRRGQGPAFRRSAGGHYRFRKSDLFRWLRGLRGPALIEVPDRKEELAAPEGQAG